MTGTDAIPVTRFGDNLLVSLRGTLDDSAVLRLEQQAAQWVASSGASGVVVDLSGLQVVDSFMARVLSRVLAMIRLVGAETVVVGVQPAVAITIVELGMPIGPVRTARNAGQGLALLGRLNG